MTRVSDSYVLTTLLAPHAPALRPNAVVRQWLRMLDPYRPELHYMRGPGPKWRPIGALPVKRMGVWHATT